MAKRENSSATTQKRSIDRMGQHSPEKLQTRVTWPTGSNVCAVVRLRMLRSKSVTGRRSQCIWPTSRTDTSSASLWKRPSRGLQNSEVLACGRLGYWVVSFDEETLKVRYRWPDKA